METVFTVSGAHLANLGDKKAVDVLRELLWAESAAMGLPRAQISVPFNIDAADGGIDGEVVGTIPASGEGLILPGMNRYQIKSGRISSLTDHVLGDLIYKEKSDELKPGVKACFESSGTFTVVLFGWGAAPRFLEDQIARITDLIRAQYPELTTTRIRVWGQDRIASVIARYPSIALQVNGRGGAMQTHKRWSSNEDMSKQYFTTAENDDKIEAIVDAVQQPSKNRRIHVFGEPGVGKTRLVLEATRHEQIRPLVLYFCSPSDLSNSDLYKQLVKEDNGFRCVLVVDECSPDVGREFANLFGPNRDRVRLVTIHNERVSRIGDTILIDVPRLPQNQIIDIISSYGIEKVDASRWAEHVAGFAREAHDVGQHLAGEEPNVLQSPDMIRVWERIIAAGCDPGSHEYLRRTLVLRCFSLFIRLGFYSDSYKSHRSALYNKVKGIDAIISQPQFESTVMTLRKAGILRGDYVLYFSRKLMHLRMWVEWWENYRGHYNYPEFVNDLPTDLADWHHEMFTYAAESPAAEQITRDLLGISGAFPTGESLNSHLSSRFFFALTNADSRTACTCLERTIGSWDVEQLMEFNDGRRYVVWSLERIVVWKETFERGARLLLALARAETEHYANNATGVFADLFSPGVGRGAPTEVPPMERMTLLAELFDSEDPTDIRIALLACERALQTRGAGRIIGPEYQGLKEPPELWAPKTWSELHEYFEAIWILLCDHLESLDKDNAERAIEILLQEARGLSRIESLAPLVQKTIERLANSDLASDEKLIKVISSILNYDRKTLHPDTVLRWEEIRDNIVGSDFGSLLKRHVGMNVIEDHFDEDGNRTDASRKKISELAKEAAAEWALLEPELDWLMSERAARGVEFGFDLGLIDIDNALLPLLIDRQKLGDNRAFLGGYFAALLDRNEDLWEATLDEIASRDDTVSWVPELTWRSGLSDSAARRVLRLAEAEKIDSDDLEPFSRGGIIRKIEESIFLEWLNFLLRVGNRKSISTALQLHHYYYAHPAPVRPMPRELTLELLLHDSLFDLGQGEERSYSLADDIWEWTSLALLSQYDDIGLEIARKYVAHFGLDPTVIGGYHSSSQKVINAIAKRFPSEVWNLVTAELGPPGTDLAFNVSRWLRGGEFYAEQSGALYFFPAEEIWNWVEEDRETRGPYLASFVPSQLTAGEGGGNLAREMLVRYGNSKSVRNEFHANYSTAVWEGPGSRHFQQKKQYLESVREKETDVNVLNWIDEEIESTEESHRRWRIDEEHRGY